LAFGIRGPYLWRQHIEPQVSAKGLLGGNRVDFICRRPFLVWPEHRETRPAGTQGQQLSFP